MELVSLLCALPSSLPHSPTLSFLMLFHIFQKLIAFFFSAVGVSTKEAHTQCVSDSAEILMVPSVGGWCKACIVTVQRVPSCHQALLAKQLNE